jgi:uncharacterized protein (UPF0333 family)
MRERAQSILEYTLLICVLIAALMAMRHYINRGIQGKLRQSGEDIGGGYFYAPRETVSDTLTTTTVNKDHSESYGTDNPDDSDIDAKISISTSEYKSDQKTQKLVPDQVAAFMVTE